MKEEEPCTGATSTQGTTSLPVRPATKATGPEVKGPAPPSRQPAGTKPQAQAPGAKPQARGTVPKQASEAAVNPKKKDPKKASK